MTDRERENLTLDFGCPDRGPVEETFYPWDLTLRRFVNDGLSPKIADLALGRGETTEICPYFSVAWGERMMEYERSFGFDSVRRCSFALPFRVFDEQILEETGDHTIRRDSSGRRLIRRKGSQIETEYAPVVSGFEDWERLKEHAGRELAHWYTDEMIDAVYGGLREGHERGDYTVRLNLEGFFWTPRELLGIERHLCAFYDEPELLREICDYILEIYTTALVRVIDWIRPDVVYIMEDLSGKNGPMISPGMFDEFVGAYYRDLIPILRRHGTGHVFVDTDGDFMKMIPNFLEAGVEGFLPMDVNAGMDILKVRERFPRVRIIGGFNKLRIAEGPEAIEREFRRIRPVIRQGGFIVGADHQVPPSASLTNYRCYIEHLRRAMEECGRG